jgi:plastocyanin
MIDPRMTRWTRRALLRTLVAAGSVVSIESLAACGGSSSKNSRTIEMTEQMRFEPDTLTVKVGDTVTWRNTSDLIHTVTADPTKTHNPSHVALPDGAAPWDSGNLKHGDAWSHRFDVAGQYRYFCIPHDVAGMVGTVVVEV